MACISSRPRISSEAVSQLRYPFSVLSRAILETGSRLTYRIETPVSSSLRGSASTRYFHHGHAFHCVAPGIILQSIISREKILSSIGLRSPIAFESGCSEYSSEDFPV